MPRRGRQIRPLRRAPGSSQRRLPQASVLCLTRRLAAGRATVSVDAFVGARPLRRTPGWSTIFDDFGAQQESDRA